MRWSGSSYLEDCESNDKHERCIVREEVSVDRVDLVGDFGPENEEFLSDVCAALKESPRRLPSQYLYDERGSELFDEICELDEYYLTRAELEILRRAGEEICATLGPACALIEFGSGSSLKTRVLLDRLHDAVAYVPVDISRDHLQTTARSLVERYPDLEILPVCADYTRAFDLPDWAISPRRCVTYFSGSTIGNMNLKDSIDMLRQLGQVSGDEGGILVGVDLHKDSETLVAAYDDRRGVTAAFELNLLERMNRELGADFDMRAWSYEAEYDTERQRIEMYVRSAVNQCVEIGSKQFCFEAGERILTEVSQKFTLASFSALSEAAGLQVSKVWTDTADQFSLHYLEPA